MSSNVIFCISKPAVSVITKFKEISFAIIGSISSNGVENVEDLEISFLSNVVNELIIYFSTLIFVEEPEALDSS